jgi:hypothetical protein
LKLSSERILGLDLLRPESPEALIDEEAFDEDEFLPYWAELWPRRLRWRTRCPTWRDCGSSSSAADSVSHRWSPRHGAPT